MLATAMALLWLGASGPADLGGEAAGRAGEPPALQWMGPHSGIAEAGFFCIEDREAWSALWERHAAECAERAQQGWVMPPDVDFARYMVVGVFAGERERTNGAMVREIELRADTLVVRYDWVQFQTASGFGGDAPEPDHSGTPYGLWLIERFDGPVVLEEDGRSLKDAPPQWREVHRFGGAGTR